MWELIEIIAFIQKIDDGLTRNIDENVFRGGSMLQKGCLKKRDDALQEQENLLEWVAYHIYVSDWFWLRNILIIILRLSNTKKSSSQEHRQKRNDK